MGSHIDRINDVDEALRKCKDAAIDSCNQTCDFVVGLAEAARDPAMKEVRAGLTFQDTTVTDLLILFAVHPFCQADEPLP